MPLPSDWQHRATKLEWSTNQHGDESAQLALDVSIDDAIAIFGGSQADAITIYGPLGEALWTGRMDDPSIALGESAGFEATLLGGWAALSDLEDSYTAMWSTVSYDEWRPATTQDNATRTAEKGEFQNEGRLFIAPKKNEAFSNAGFVLAYTYQTPHSGRRGVIGIQFDWEFKAPSNWQFIVTSFDRDYTTQTVVYTVNATGAVLSGSVRGTFGTAVDRLEFALYYNAASANYTGETGVDAYLKITNLRLTSTSTYQTSTTLTGAVAAGVNILASVGSTANMYAGQRLTINSSLATGVSESVIVETVPNSTQFSADFALAHASGQTVLGLRVDAEEVASDIATFVNSVNPGQLAAGGALQFAGRDLTQCGYEDTTPSEVINDLLTRARSASGYWEAGVENGALYFRLRGSTARAWAIDIDAFTVTTSLADLFNSAYLYATFEDNPGQLSRTAVATDEGSVEKYGLTRRKSIALEETDTAGATTQRDAFIDENKYIRGRATLSNITALYDLAGGRCNLWEASAGRGDTITIRNIAPEIAADLGAALTFRLTRTTYDARSDTLTVELEAPRPGLDTL